MKGVVFLFLASLSIDFVGNKVIILQASSLFSANLQMILTNWEKFTKRFFESDIPFRTKFR